MQPQLHLGPDFLAFVSKIEIGAEGKRSCSLANCNIVCDKADRSVKLIIQVHVLSTWVRANTMRLVYIGT
jgi:hypothetical protein